MLVAWKVWKLWPANEREPDLEKQYSYKPAWVKNGFSNTKELFKGLKIEVARFEGFRFERFQFEEMSVQNIQRVGASLHRRNCSKFWKVHI